MKKTNALRLLDRDGIDYNLFSYDITDGNIDGKAVADKVGKPRERVFKTLAARGSSGEYRVFVIPVTDELDLKKAARASGEKKIDLIPVKELLSLTGYVRGGCSPIGMKNPLPVYIDETAELFDAILVSAGMKGLQMEVGTGDLIRAARAVTADLF